MEKATKERESLSRGRFEKKNSFETGHDAYDGTVGDFRGLIGSWRHYRLGLTSADHNTLFMFTKS